MDALLFVIEQEINGTAPTLQNYVSKVLTNQIVKQPIDMEIDELPSTSNSGNHNNGYATHNGNEVIPDDMLICSESKFGELIIDDDQIPVGNTVELEFGQDLVDEVEKAADNAVVPDDNRKSGQVIVTKVEKSLYNTVVPDDKTIIKKSEFKENEVKKRPKKNDVHKSDKKRNPLENIEVPDNKIKLEQVSVDEVKKSVGNTVVSDDESKSGQVPGDEAEKSVVLDNEMYLTKREFTENVITEMKKRKKNDDVHKANKKQKPLVNNEVADNKSKLKQVPVDEVKKSVGNTVVSDDKSKSGQVPGDEAEKSVVLDNKMYLTKREFTENVITEMKKRKKNDDVHKANKEQKPLVNNEVPDNEMKLNENKKKKPFLYVMQVAPKSPVQDEVLEKEMSEDNNEKPTKPAHEEKPKMPECCDAAPTKPAFRMSWYLMENVIKDVTAPRSGRIREVVHVTSLLDPPYSKGIIRYQTQAGPQHGKLLLAADDKDAVNDYKKYLEKVKAKVSLDDWHLVQCGSAAQANVEYAIVPRNEITWPEGQLPQDGMPFKVRLGKVTATVLYSHFDDAVLELELEKLKEYIEVTFGLMTQGHREEESWALVQYNHGDKKFGYEILNLKQCILSKSNEFKDDTLFLTDGAEIFNVVILRRSALYKVLLNELENIVGFGRNIEIPITPSENDTGAIYYPPELNVYSLISQLDQMWRLANAKKLRNEDELKAKILDKFLQNNYG